MIIGMIKAHPTQNRMPKQAPDYGMAPRQADNGGRVAARSLCAARSGVSRSRAGLLLPEVNGLVPWLLARTALLAGAGVLALVVDPLGGPGTGAAQPDYCNRAVPLIGCRSGHSVPAAWAELDKGGPHAER